MARDIRELLRNMESGRKQKMPEGHREEFQKLLDKELPRNSVRVPVFWLQVAAGVALVAAVATFVFFQQEQVVSPENSVVNTESDEATTVKQLTLGDLSPDLSKIENFYLANINMELAGIEMKEEYKDLISGYLSRLTELHEEYEALTEELNTLGPNEATINALINNLQMRLNLLYRLKDQLNEFKSENDETINTHTI